MDKTYAQNAIQAIRALPRQADGVILWEYPEQDLAAYLTMPDTRAFKTYGDYLAVIAAIQADIERQGKIVVRVKATVADVVAELGKRGLPNNNQNRAAVLGLLASKQGSQT